MAVLNIITHKSLSGPHEVSTFTGHPNQTTLTVGREDEYLGEWVRWRLVGGTQAQDQWRDLAGKQVIYRGTLFVRPVTPTGDEAADPVGGWRFWRHSWDGATDALRMRVVPPVVTAAGSPMRNPLGEPVMMRDGTRPNQPASGEQARDPWSGQLVVDAQGNPVLVP